MAEIENLKGQCATLNEEKEAIHREKEEKEEEKQNMLRENEELREQLREKEREKERLNGWGWMILQTFWGWISEVLEKERN